MAAALTDESATIPTAAVAQKQTASGWDTSPDFPDNFEVDDPTTSGSWTLTYTKDGSGMITGVKATHS